MEILKKKPYFEALQPSHKNLCIWFFPVCLAMSLPDKAPPSPAPLHSSSLAESVSSCPASQLVIASPSLQQAFVE